MNRSALILILIAFIGYIAGIFTGLKHCPRCGDSVTVKLDTVWVEIGRDLTYAPIPQPKDIIIRVHTRDTIRVAYPVPEPYYLNLPVADSIWYKALVYDSTAVLDSLSIHYRITTLGRITDMQFGYSYKYPSITKTITQVRQPTGIYAGGFVNPYTFGPSITLVRPRWVGSYGFGTDKGHTFSFGVKVGK
jgi:hypothetical protein